ncbi:23S rRNA (adenine(2030)-N(6))-methyltransferase RlmJ [Agaribacter marinus]|uniref:Ribosomal RNA large subunit methyltransferase J n=1 Tax=Agaribacter marinus TaxID=1431249 RepID=A0AA37T1E6_9ALTE|nr:23S rRNA (adenine(2030)-N(6))-methyltransferase RlmJ [Agaribacter marinus]GLR69895.1 ribosomal RNA large subunit methyltransferase J [Agaribacter marinus]
MLSYQHKFHAGNHADVFKHLTLIALMSKFNQKSKPYFYLDTHAGEGKYPLSSVQIHQDEYAFNALSFSQDLAELKAYRKIFKKYKQNDEYPGSPAFAIEMAREQDNLHFNELANDAFGDLKYFIHRTGSVHHRNAFEVLKGLMPPKPNRGMVLIDPPYEDADEYNQVHEAVCSALRKWPNGTFAIWYPLLASRRINRKTKQLENTPKSGMSEQMVLSLAEAVECPMMDVTFNFTDNDGSVGMYGSGICIINPPFKVDASIREILSLLESEVAMNGVNQSSLTWLNPQL